MSSKLTTGPIVLAALAGWVLAVVALFAARSIYIEAKWSRMAPSVQRYQSQNPTLGDKTQPRLVLFGDSRIEQWSPPLALPGVEVINRGISGETTVQMLTRVSQDVVDLDVDCVVVQAGINDLVTAGLRPAQTSKITGSTAQNLADISAIAGSHGARVLLLSVAPASRLDPLRRLVWGGTLNSRVDAVNAAIAELVEATPVNTLDLIGALTTMGLSMEDLYRDPLHFTPQAYGALAEIVGQWVAQDCLGEALE